MALQIRQAVLPVFHPTKRFALLINGMDGFEGLGRSYSPLNSYERGNVSILLMEAALRRGTLDLRPEIQAHLESRGMKIKACENAQRIQDAVQETYDRTGGHANACLDIPGLSKMAVSAARLAYDSFFNVMPERYALLSTIDYDRIDKVYPYGPHPINDQVSSILSMYQAMADAGSLTYVFITAHGNRTDIGGLKMTDLLERLDHIPGNKVVIGLACHSGNLIEILGRQKPQTPFNIFTDSSAHRRIDAETSDCLAGDISYHVAHEHLMSRLVASAPRYERIARQARSRLDFDVIL